jgi:hypothetical protein
MQAYSHRQHSPVIPVVLALTVIVMMGGLFMLPRGVDPGPYVTAVMMVIVVLAALAIFSRLTTGVDESGVSWAFGFGFPRGSIESGEIARAERTQTSFWEGWGIHWTIWHGWLWNVGGFQAVQIFKRDGTSITIGTDDPQGLLNAINALRRARGESI